MSRPAMTWAGRPTFPISATKAKIAKRAKALNAAYNRSLPRTDAQIAAHNERARKLAAKRMEPPRVPTEREQVLRILRTRCKEPGITQDEFLARWRRYKQVMEATRPKKQPTAERSAAGLRQT